MICQFKPPVKRYPREQTDPILNNENVERPPNTINIKKKIKKPKEILLADI